MRLLIIDGGSGKIESLRELCNKHQLTTIAVDEFMSVKPDDFDGVLLTGNSVDIASFIQATDMPVVGVGVGFDAVCEAFGVSLDELGERAPAAVKIIPTDNGAKIFQGSDPMTVAETERWNIEELPKSLVVLARSETGIEAIRHKTKLIFGLQLYLQDFAYASDAKLVYENLLNILLAYSKRVT